MRDRQTQRGRGFGFVKMQFDSQNKAQEIKSALIDVNKRQGHVINDKIVDVKSADDYKKDPNQPDRSSHHTGFQYQQRQPYEGQRDGMGMSANKPNPYVAHGQQDGREDFDRKAEHYKYPKSKIFVGGLDFKLTQHDMLQHFS